MGKFGGEYKDLEYSINLFGLDCKGKRVKSIHGADYSKGGGVITSDSEETNWKYIYPGSITERLYKEICK
jgi:hypothetical protein